jgi:hypothetical protein
MGSFHKKEDQTRCSTGQFLDLRTSSIGGMEAIVGGVSTQHKVTQGERIIPFLIVI